MERRENRREYSAGENLVRVKPHDDRTIRYRNGYNGKVYRQSRNGMAAGTGRSRKGNTAGRYGDIRMAVMIVITLVLLFLSARSVCSLLEPREKTGMTSMSEISSDVNKEEGIPQEEGKGVVPVVDEGPFSGSEFLVAIDPGHGGIDNGSNIDGVYEQTINLEIALRLADKLEEMGIGAVLLREDNDTSLSLEERVEKAENAGADIYVSIHQNFYDGKDASVSGMETWYSGNLQDSKRLAELVHEGAAKQTGANDRGLIESNDLYVVREASMPSCLIETGFLSNREERNALLTGEYQEKIAEGIAEGIGEYFRPDNSGKGR